MLKRKNRIYHLVVDKVISSPFTQQVMKGDWIESINGKRASDYYANPNKTAQGYSYKLRASDNSVNSGAAYEITSPVPIAVSLKPSSEFLLKYLQDKDIEWEYLEILWERKEFKLLKKAVKELSFNPVVGKVISTVFRNDIVNTPAKLFKGVLEFHNGNQAKASKLIKQYEEKAINSYTTNFHAITYLYLGLLSDDAEQRKQYLSMSNNYNTSSSETINQHVLEANMELATDSPKLGTQFPLTENLVVMDSGESFSLDDYVTKADKDISLMCVMPAYRANGPYSSFIKNYRTMYPYFKDHFNPMVVIADTQEYDNTKYWLKAEKAVIQQGLPLHVLKDSAEAVNWHLEQRVSPVMYAINRSGKILYQGSFDQPIHYWQILAK